jgi:hypothetical protein
VKDRLGCGGYREMSFLRPIDHAGRVLLATAALLGTLAGGSSHAAARCELVVVGAAGTAWEHAVESLPPPRAADCAALRLAVGEFGAGAQLTFILRDGRRAERQLIEPSELAPAVEALATTGLMPRAASPPSVATDPNVIEADESADEPFGVDLVLGIASGARAGHSALLSPLLTVSAALAFGEWELGLTFAYEMRYFDLQNREFPGWRSGAVGLGVLFGRREPLGDLAFVWGARASIARLTNDAQSSDGPASRSLRVALDPSPYEGRVGAYLGLTFPVSAGVRFRTELGADFVATSRWEASSVLPALEVAAITPEWALCALAGLELVP